MHAAAFLVALLLSAEQPDQIAPGDGADRAAPAPSREVWIGGIAPPAAPAPDGAPAPPAPPAPPARLAPSARLVEPDSGTGEPTAEPGSSPAAFQVSLEGARGWRGESSLQAVAQWRGDGVSVGLGAEGVAGDRIASRQGLIAQAEVSLASVALHGELRLRPAQAGASRSAAELGARVEGEPGSVDLTLHGVSALAAFDARAPRTGPEGEAAFLAVSASAEVEGIVSPSLAAALRLSAAANQLRWTGRTPARPWDALGSALQEWPERWEATASLRATAGPAALTLSGGAAAPAAPGALAAQASIRLDLDAGAVTFSAAAGGAHQWPADLWLAELTLGAAVRFGSR